MSVIDCIGNTPLVELTRIWNPDKTGVRILAKLEGANPGGSVKDRPALFMLKTAIASGELTPEKTILEPTSGNTGIGMAMIAAALGYRIKLIMPACVSQERRGILIALGAELELTPGCDKTDGAILRAHHIMEHFGDKYYMPNQFANPANWRSHYETTAPEIIRDTRGSVDAFVAGMGTTGTLMGCARYFHEHKPNVEVVGIEPTINHRIQGLKNMQESIVPAIYDPKLLSRKIICTDDQAFETFRDLALREGLFCGLSSGAALWGAMEVARDLPRGSTVVVVFPDRGDRYLSTEAFRSVCALCPP
ncbi:MAG: PLP-dependent cysteine synthase family protein [Desulfobacterota bacterium]|nr:PLP-dependent cysteine synthase family protein [Thermodesulfobacteriota bacterium]